MVMVREMKKVYWGIVSYSFWEGLGNGLLMSFI